MTNLEVETVVATPEYSPEDAAYGIAENLGLFMTGEKDTFDAYFVQHIEPQRETEENFAILAGIDLNTVMPSSRPIEVLKQGEVTLYRWSNIIDNQPFDAYYQACRGDDKPSRFYGELVVG